MSGSYAERVPDWHEADAAEKARAIAVFCRDIGWTPTTVCDVGCGAGGVLRGVCAELNATGVGVDVSPEAVARARAAATPVVRFEVGDVAAAPRCDLVLCVDVVEHVADDLGLVAALGRVAPRVLLRLPLDASALDVVRPGRMLAARSEWGHRHVYTVDLAMAMVLEAGLGLVAHRFDRVAVRPASRLGRISDGVRRICHSVAPGGTSRWLGGYSLLLACTSKEL